MCTSALYQRAGLRRPYSETLAAGNEVSRHNPDALAGARPPFASDSTAFATAELFAAREEKKGVTFLQTSNPDVGIHLTLGSGIAALLGKILWDEFRGKNRNGNVKELRDLTENAKLQTQLLSQQTEILQRMATDIAVLKDRTK